jgi:hypothetical protein
VYMYTHSCSSLCNGWLDCADGILIVSVMQVAMFYLLFVYVFVLFLSFAHTCFLIDIWAVEEAHIELNFQHNN